MRKFLKIVLIIIFCFNVLLTGIGITDIFTNDKDPSVELSKTLDLNTELNRVKAEEKEVYANFSSKREKRNNAKKEYNDLQDKVIEQEEEKERQREEAEEQRQLELEQQQKEQEKQQQQEQKAYNNYSNKHNNKRNNYKDSYSGPEVEEGYVYCNGGRSSSNKYHSSAHAHGMKDAIKMTKKQAEASGYVACKRCY